MGAYAMDWTQMMRTNEGMKYNDKVKRASDLGHERLLENLKRVMRRYDGEGGYVVWFGGVGTDGSLRREKIMCVHEMTMTEDK